MSTLDLAARTALLEKAQQIAGKLGSSARRQAASAEAILNRFGFEQFEQMLRLDLPAGGAAKPWQEFRREFSQHVGAVRRTYGEEGLRFLLGWVRRYPVTDHRPVTSGPRPGNQRHGQPPRRR